MISIFLISFRFGMGTPINELSLPDPRAQLGLSRMPLIIELLRLFPLYCTGWFRADVVHDPVHPFYLIDDP